MEISPSWLGQIRYCLVDLVVMMLLDIAVVLRDRQRLDERRAALTEVEAAAEAAKAAESEASAHASEAAEKLLEARAEAERLRDLRQMEEQRMQVIKCMN